MDPRRWRVLAVSAEWRGDVSGVLVVAEAEVLGERVASGDHCG
jgi:hypothetical protein